MNKIIEYFKNLFKSKSDKVKTEIITIELTRPIYFIPPWNKNGLEKFEINIHGNDISKGSHNSYINGFNYRDSIKWISYLNKKGLTYIIPNSTDYNIKFINYLSNDKYDLLEIDPNIKYEYNYVINDESENYYISDINSNAGKLDFDNDIGIVSDGKDCIFAEISILDKKPVYKDLGGVYSNYIEIISKLELENKLLNKKLERFDNL